MILFLKSEVSNINQIIGFKSNNYTENSIPNTTCKSVVKKITSCLNENFRTLSLYEVNLWNDNINRCTVTRFESERLETKSITSSYKGPGEVPCVLSPRGKWVGGRELRRVLPRVRDCSALDLMYSWPQSVGETMVVLVRDEWVWTHKIGSALPRASTHLRPRLCTRKPAVVLGWGTVGTVS